MSCGFLIIVQRSDSFKQLQKVQIAFGTTRTGSCQPAADQALSTLIVKRSSSEFVFLWCPVLDQLVLTSCSGSPILTFRYQAECLLCFASLCWVHAVTWLACKKLWLTEAQHLRSPALLAAGFQHPILPSIQPAVSRPGNFGAAYVCTTLLSLV